MDRELKRQNIGNFLKKAEKSYLPVFAKRPQSAPHFLKKVWSGYSAVGVASRRMWRSRRLQSAGLHIFIIEIVPILEVKNAKENYEIYRCF